jgi:hypothetical protein
MRRKKLLVFVFMAFVASGVFAQTEGFALGARVIGIIPRYEPSSDFKNALGGLSVDLDGGFRFGFAAQASYNFTELFGIQLELLYNSDEVAIKAMGIEVATLEASSLLIPILVRIGTTVGDGIVLTGLAGLYFTVPLGDGEIKFNPLAGMPNMKGSWKGSLGMMIGGVVGYNVGPGTLFGDLRYGFDFSEIEFEFMGITEKVLKKSAFHIGIGYSIPIGR